MRSRLIPFHDMRSQNASEIVSNTHLHLAYVSPTSNDKNYLHEDREPDSWRVPLFAENVLAANF